MRINQQHQKHLIDHGYVHVQGFLEKKELDAARANMLRYYPTAEEIAATPERYGAIVEEGDQLQTEFPFAGDALNDISTHREIISFVERLLGMEDVLLSQAAIWAKYAGAGDYEQGLHLDYQGNTLVVPRDDGDYRQVNMILYYTDVTEDLGPTFVVSQKQTKDLPLWPTFRTRSKDAALYRKEKPILAKAGDLLIFSMRTWHRASAIEAKTGMRLSHHLVYRAATHSFIGYHNWSSRGEKPDLQRLMQRATPRQREVLGFPKAGDAYWTTKTIAEVGKRYPKMDMSVYRKS